MTVVYDLMKPGYRWVLRSLIATAWLAVAGAAIAALTVRPNGIVEEIGPEILLISMSVLIVSSVVAAAGLMLNHFHWEWVAAWLAAAAIAPYLTTIWALTFYNEAPRATGAFMVSGLFLFMMTRAIGGAAYASLLRAVHTNTVEIIGRQTGGSDYEPKRSS